MHLYSTCYRIQDQENRLNSETLVSLMYHIYYCLNANINQTITNF